jgi:DTW domain-containing protein YfiP
MAHLGLANSELHCGVTFADLARAVGSAAGGTALLFPGPGAALPDVRSAPRTLVVIDGTWSQARSLLGRNPYLATLPRLGLAPSTPSTYRIRREPAPHCLSTVEAIVHVLACLEGDAARFAPLLQAFDRMVTFQLDCAARRLRATQAPSAIGRAGGLP